MQMLEDTNDLTLKASGQDILSAFQKNGFYIDRVEKTPERCLAAVRQNGLALKVIPKSAYDRFVH